MTQYNKTTWIPHQTVGTADIMNNIEEGIERVSTELEHIANVSNGTNINTLLQNNKRVILPKGEYVIDVIMPKNTTLIGDGDETWIKGNLIVNSGCVVENLKIGITGKTVTTQNGTNGTTFNNVVFTGGATSSNGAFWINDKSTQNITFSKCLFVDCEYNGVTLVDKGTVDTHIENIRFDKCVFKNNKRMNLECLVRKGVDDVVDGYKNISLNDCTFIGGTNINVSFDSNSITSDLNVKKGGYSTVNNCTFDGGLYCLEQAGATNMIITNNKFKPNSSTTHILSTSQLKNMDNKTVFKGNKIEGDKIVTFQGNNNIISNNIISCQEIIFNEFNNSTFLNNNVYSVKNGAILIVESSEKNVFTENIVNAMNATMIFGLYYVKTKNNTITRNNFITNGTFVYEYQLGASGLDAVADNYFNGIKVDVNYIRSMKYNATSTTTKLFTILSSETLAQREAMVKCCWYGRHNNSAIGGEFVLNFGKYDQKGQMPLISQLGTPITVSIVDNADDTFSYNVNITSNTACSCVIEVFGNPTTISNYKIV